MQHIKSGDQRPTKRYGDPQEREVDTKQWEKTDTMIISARKREVEKVRK